MRTQILSSLASACLLSACGTAPRFNDAMEGAVKTTKNASEIVDTAERDLIRAHAVGAVQDLLPGAGPTLSQLTCEPRAGLAATSESLNVFSEATDLVAKVAKKPDDTTYAGYIAKLKADREAAKLAQGGDLLKQKADEDQAARQRCTDLFQADILADPRLGLPRAVGTTNYDVLAVIGALNGVFKTLLSSIEAAKRDTAVRATVVAVIPPMKEALDKLKSKYAGNYGPVVRFNAAPAEVIEMNSTVLGGAITLERWFVARKIDVLWKSLSVCWPKPPAMPRGMSCLADPSVRANTDALVEAIYAYRGLAQIDTKKILDKLDNSIASAEKSTALGTADILESIATIAGSLSDLSDARDKFIKAKE